VGNVGSKVEKFARIMGMNVLLNDPPRARAEGLNDFVSFETVLSESDIITVHVPLNFVGEDCTYHFFDEENLKKIKKDAWFINSSRGEVIETRLLKKALYSNRLRGAVLDVWENEPDIDKELMQRAFFATPHIAGYSSDGKANGTAMVVNSLCKYFDLPSVNWYPDHVPLPDYPLLTIDCTGKSEESIVREAVVHTYDIDEDNAGLRFAPSDFEKLRGDYPCRREFNSYTINLHGATQEIQQILEALGFNLQI
jgi:erythronate-4-phosphate dehydrogenase